MTQLIAVALHHRDHFSRGNARKTFGYEAYHWGIFITPETSKGRDCQTFEATDTSYIDPVTFRMTNPSMDWWFRVESNVDPALSAKLLVRIVIGHVPDGIASADVHSLLERVPLPIKNTQPQQSCVSWVVDAVRSLQRQGWVWDFDINRFKDLALSYADEKIKQPDFREPNVKQYLSSD